MRLIDADALLQEIDGIYKRHYANSTYQFIHDFFRAMLRRVNKTPTIKAEPVKHATWVLYVCNEPPFSRAMGCTNCGFTHNYNAWFNRCPNCAAIMGLEVKE